MRPFYRFTTNFNGHIPVFDTSGLDDKQLNFLNGCVKVWDNPDFKDKGFNLASVFWRNNKDFAGTIVTVDDPFIAQLEMEAMLIDAGLSQ